MSATEFDEAEASIRASHAPASLEQVVLDLADLSSVRRAAARIASFGAIDVLVNNAGVMGTSHQRTVDGLRRREQSALDHLEKMVLEERSPAEIQAQADKVVTLHHELTEARVESREAEAVADREQVQANRAARHLEDAEAGRPPLVADRVDLKDRLG